MSRFVSCDRSQPFLLPPDLRDWLPDDDIAHLIIEAVERVDLRQFKVNVRGTGSAQYHPQMLLALLIYGYAHGIISSRKIERACYRDLAMRYIAANQQPDHDTICKFRRENGQAISEAFVQVLVMAQELGVLKVGLVSVDKNQDKNQDTHNPHQSRANGPLQSDCDDRIVWKFWVFVLPLVGVLCPGWRLESR